MSEKVTIKRALAAGFWRINFPVLAIMFLPWAVTFAAFSFSYVFQPLWPAWLLAIVGGVLIVASLFSIPAAWIWWSFAVPKWKLWAYSCVDDIAALKLGAIQDGLIWPDGHIFEKTEICSKAMRQQILTLEGRL